MTETQLQASVIDAWRKLGRPHTLVAAIPNAHAFGQPGLTRGLPDLLCIGGSIGCGFIELKRSKSATVSDEQRAVLDLLHFHMLHAAICCGFDEAIDQLQRWQIIRPTLATETVA